MKWKSGKVEKWKSRKREKSKCRAADHDGMQRDEAVGAAHRVELANARWPRHSGADEQETVAQDRRWRSSSAPEQVLRGAGRNSSIPVRGRSLSRLSDFSNGPSSQCPVGGQIPRWSKPGDPDCRWSACAPGQSACRLRRTGGHRNYLRAAVCPGRELDPFRSEALNRTISASAPSHRVPRCTTETQRTLSRRLCVSEAGT